MLAPNARSMLVRTLHVSDIMTCRIMTCCPSNYDVDFKLSVRLTRVRVLCVLRCVCFSVYVRDVTARGRSQWPMCHTSNSTATKSTPEMPASRVVCIMHVCWNLLSTPFRLKCLHLSSLSEYMFDSRLCACARVLTQGMCEGQSTLLSRLVWDSGTTRG